MVVDPSQGWGLPKHSSFPTVGSAGGDLHIDAAINSPSSTSILTLGKEYKSLVIRIPSKSWMMDYFEHRTKDSRSICQ